LGGTVDLQQLVQQAMVDMSVLGSHRGIEFELAVSGVPEILGDPDDLRLLLDNLLGNALKFSPPNSVVEVSIDQQGSQVTLLVRDYGPGIAPELRERILLPFVRVDATVEGAGLGLAIAMEVAQNHRANLSFEDPSDRSGLVVRVVFAAQMSTS